MKALEHRTVRSLATEESRRWQHRRTELLKAACTHVAEQIASGTKVGQAIKVAARKFRNRSLGGGRQLALSKKSLTHHWGEFRRHGESAFVCRYVPSRQANLDPLFLRLIIRSAILQAQTVSQILTEAGLDCGDRRGHASLRTIYRAVPSPEIRKFLLAEKRLLARRKSTEEALLHLNAQLRDLRAAAKEKFLTEGAA